MSDIKSIRFSTSSSTYMHLIRGLAAQAVVIGHGLVYFLNTKNYEVLQTSAVVIFFVISGLVISSSVFSKREKDPEYSFISYLIDRFARIYTGLIPGILFVLLIDFVSLTYFKAEYRYINAFNVRTFLGNLLMLEDYPFQSTIRSLAGAVYEPLSNLLAITSFGSARPFWTIAVEWWIYLGFGWIALGSKYKKSNPFFYWSMLLILNLIPLFNWVFSGRGVGLTMMWSLGVVVFIALAYFQPQTNKKDSGILAAVFFFFAITRLLFTGTSYDVLYAGLLAISLYFLLCYAQFQGDFTHKRTGSTIVFIADISYMLYLVHYSIMDFIFVWLGPGFWNLVLVFVVSNLIAMILHLLFDNKYKIVGKNLKQMLNVR